MTPGPGAYALIGSALALRLVVAPDAGAVAWIGGTVTAEVALAVQLAEHDGRAISPDRADVIAGSAEGSAGAVTRDLASTVSSRE